MPLPNRAMRRLLSWTIVLGAALATPGAATTPPTHAAPCSGAGSGTAAGKVFLTIEEALALAFPGCEVEQQTAYLSKEERAEAERLSGVDVPQAVLRYWVAHRGGELVGTAYAEAHKVRTLKESVMVVVDPRARIARFEVLAFGEPEEYIPRGSWYQQLVGHPLDDELQLGRGIHAVSGATLTARASTGAARRILALHQVLARRSQRG